MPEETIVIALEKLSATGKWCIGGRNNIGKTITCHTGGGYKKKSCHTDPK